MDHHHMMMTTTSENPSMNQPHNHEMSGGGEPTDSMMGMMMKMFFHFGLGDLFLFQGLVLDSAWKLWLASFVLFIGAILLEAIDYTRGYLTCRCKDAGPGRHRCQSAASSTAPLIRDIDPIVGSPKAPAHHGVAAMGPPGQQLPAAATIGGCCSSAAAAAATLAHNCNNLPNGATANTKQLSGQTDDGFAPTRGACCRPTVASRSAAGASQACCKLPCARALRLTQAGLQFLRTGLSFGLMLAAMTYNVCLIFAILLGAGVGFYIFYRPALEIRSACH